MSTGSRLVWYVRTYVRTARTRVNQFGGHLPTMPPLPRLSLCARQHTWHLLSKGNTCATVVALLQKEGTVTTRQTVWRLERHVLAHSTIEPRLKPGRPLLWISVRLTTEWRVMTRQRAHASLSAKQSDA